MQAVKIWFHKNKNLEYVPAQEMNLIFDGVNNRAVGIWAGNICTIDYGTLGQVRRACFYKNVKTGRYAKIFYFL